MLRLAYALEQLDFGLLMTLYRVGNEENGRYFWPDKSPDDQIRLAENAFFHYLHDDFFLKEQAVYALLEVDDAYVSALRLEPYQDGWLLEALETDPKERRNGYASRLIYGVKRWLGGGIIYSHVSKENIASLKLHKKCGFIEFLPYEVNADGTKNPDAVTLMCQIDPE